MGSPPCNYLVFCVRSVGVGWLENNVFWENESCMRPHLTNAFRTRPRFLLLCSYKIAIEFIISFTDVSSRDGDVETTAKLSLDDSQDVHAMRLRCYGADLLQYEAIYSRKGPHKICFLLRIP